MASYQDLVTQVVREASEPLRLDEVLRRLSERQPVKSANPKKTIRNALSNSAKVGALGDGRYVYAPRAISGSSFRVLLDGIEEFAPLLPVGDEVAACLMVNAAELCLERQVTLRLTGGSMVEGTLRWERNGVAAIALPGEFWAWLPGVRQGGADSLLLRCLDGERDTFSLEGSRQADVDPGALAARGEDVLAVARRLFRTGENVSIRDFFCRLVVRGAYRGEPQPSPLNRLLFQVDRRFIVGIHSISYRSELTPGLLRLFEERLAAEQEGATIRMDPVERPRFQGRLRQEGLFAALPYAEQRDEMEIEEVQAVPEQPAQQLYRLRVRLRWMPGVWRIIEMLDNQDLDSLHLAIQEAFEWGNDHLYAFFLSGRAWDGLTEIPSPDVEDTEPPFADVVTLRDLELKPGQSFLYLFDFGDQLCHDVEVLEVLPIPASGKYPRIAEVRGKAPPQYQDWDEEPEEGSDED